MGLSLNHAIRVVKGAAFGVKAIRGVRLLRSVVSQSLAEAEKNAPLKVAISQRRETGYMFGKKFDPKTGVITYDKITRTWPAEFTRIHMPDIPDRELELQNSAHSHPFDCLRENVWPSFADPRFIRELQGGLATSATIIFGGGKEADMWGRIFKPRQREWGIGAWVYDERELDFKFSDLRAHLSRIYSLPVQVIDDQSGRVLTPKELGKLGVVHIENYHPYLEPTEEKEDVSDIIALRKWFLAARTFQEAKTTSGFRIVGGTGSDGLPIMTSTEEFLEELKRLLRGTSRPEFVSIYRTLFSTGE
jgi:hypothetical protein